MRVLTVGNMYPPHHLGGYELIWSSWVAYAEAHGHRVRVLTTDFETDVDPGESNDADGDVHRTLRWYWKQHDFPRLGPAARWAIERHNARVVEAELEEFRPQAVVWWAMGGMSLSLIERVRRHGLPAVGVLCDDWLLYAPTVDAWSRAFSRRPRLARLVQRSTGAITRVDLGPAASWVFLSETLRRRALSAWPNLGESEVAHRGPDVELFRAEPGRPWGWKLLYVGRIDRRKGIDLAILALADLPEQATLTVVGSGDDDCRAELERLASERGLERRVSFGRVGRAELNGVYGDHDAVLFPVRWAEPWGLVPLEAMAVGRPVVATGLGGSGEYLEHGENCLLFDPSHGPDELAERVRALADDAGLRERLREAGFRTVASLSAEAFNARVLAAVEREGQARLAR